jgi:helicase
MTYLLERWISEASEDQIISQFGVGSGDIFRFVETADWLLYAMYEIAKLLNIKEEFPYIRRVRTRINYGVKEELLDLVKLVGVGRIRARRLYDAGLKNTRDLAAVKIEELSEIPTIGNELAKKIKKQVSDTTEDNTNLLSPTDRQTSLKDFR